MDEEYDLKKSSDGIGQLYPILVAKDGEIIDGVHRGRADKDWKRVRLEHIDTEEKKLLARLIANFHRRQVTREEKGQWINGLAEIYIKESFKVCGEHGKNEVVARICEKTGLTEQTVRIYLSQKYLQSEPEHLKETKKSSVPASQVIKTRFDNVKEGYGEQIVERHREELKQNPEFQKEVLQEIQKQPEEIVREMVDEIAPVAQQASENFEKARKSNEAYARQSTNRIFLGMVLKNLEKGEVFCPLCNNKTLVCGNCHASLDEMMEAAKVE